MNTYNILSALFALKLVHGMVILAGSTLHLDPEVLTSCQLDYI